MFPSIVLSCTTTPSGCCALRLPDTLPWLGTAGLSTQGYALWGSQPRINVAPRWTLRLPCTVSAELPSAKAASTTAPGLTVRLPSMRAGPALTTHAPSTTTLEEYVPASTPGDSKLPEHFEGRSAAAALALAARMLSASPTAPSTSDDRRGESRISLNPLTSMFLILSFRGRPMRPASTALVLQCTPLAGRPRQHASCHERAKP